MRPAAVTEVLEMSKLMIPLYLHFQIGVVAGKCVYALVDKGLQDYKQWRAVFHVDKMIPEGERRHEEVD